VSKIGLRGVLLAAFLLTSGAPLAAFWLWPYAAAREGAETAVRERHLVLATTLAAALGRQETERVATFQIAAPALAAGPPAPDLVAALVLLRLNHACVHDAASGALLGAVPLARPAACPGLLAPEQVVALSALSGGPERAARPGAAGDDGFALGWTDGRRIVSAVASFEPVRDLAAGVSFGAKGHMVVADETGRIVHHPRADWTAERRDIGGLEPVRRALAGESGVARFVSPAIGAEVLAGFAPAPGVGWAVMVPQPVAEITGRAQIVAGAALAIFAAGCVLSAATALALSFHLRRSLGRVSDAALRMARGEAGVRLAPEDLRHGVTELAVLGRAFDTMARRIDGAQSRAATLARFDGLTGLRNRGAFFSEAGALLADARDAGRAYALFFIDIDRFKTVNDLHGHIVGDALLQRVADRLRRIAGADDLVARHSGDEFLLLHAKRREGSCAALGARLLRALTEPEDIGGRRIELSASIGVSAFPRDACDLNALVVHADQAMYEAKRQGRNRLRHFDDTLRKRVEEDMALRRELQAALSADAVAAVFQPLVRAQDGRIAGFEALARWTSPSLGPIPPERFVRVAEDSGLVIALGRAIRRRAFAFAERLRREGAPCPVSVNVSPLELAQTGFAEDVEALLRQHDLPPSAIVLELTETLFIENDPRQIEGLMALRTRGVGLALDDFGKGFSSHGRLRTYPVDRLKIDIGFAGDVETDPQARAVVESLVSLGRSLSLTVSVEGVETDTQRALALAWGADEIQGFAHHPPLREDVALRLAVGEVSGAPFSRAG
jgi:diguanylate cyclase (GGDEF)-like protein